jgi:hypothetical protein
VTLATLRKKLNLKPKDVLSIELFPAPLTPTEKVLKLLKGFGAESAMVRVALGQWHNLTLVMGPMLNGMDGFSPVAARAPVLPGMR